MHVKDLPACQLVRFDSRNLPCVMETYFVKSTYQSIQAMYGCKIQIWRTRRDLEKPLRSNPIGSNRIETRLFKPGGKRTCTCRSRYFMFMDTYSSRRYICPVQCTKHCIQHAWYPWYDLQHPALQNLERCTGVSKRSEVCLLHCWVCSDQAWIFGNLPTH